MNATRDLLQRVVDLIDPSEPGSADIDEARRLISRAGIEPNMHVGDDPKTFDEQRTYEWILGQFADVIDTKTWFAMNSGINIARARLDDYAQVSS